jgi:hypothetical protein
MNLWWNWNEKWYQIYYETEEQKKKYKELWIMDVTCLIQLHTFLSTLGLEMNTHVTWST